MVFFESDTKLVSVGEDSRAFVWELMNGTLLRELVGHYGPITDCVFSFKGDVIGTASLDCQFIIWKAGTYLQDHVFKTKYVTVLLREREGPLGLHVWLRCSWLSPIESTLSSIFVFHDSILDITGRVDSIWIVRVVRVVSRDQDPDRME